MKFISVIGGFYVLVPKVGQLEQTVEIVERVVLQDRENHSRWDMAMVLQS